MNLYAAVGLPNNTNLFHIVAEGKEAELKLAPETQRTGW